MHEGDHSMNGHTRGDTYRRLLENSDVEDSLRVGGKRFTKSEDSDIS